MLPSTVFDALVSSGNNALVDIRSVEDKADAGVPDLPQPSKLVRCGVRAACGRLGADPGCVRWRGWGRAIRAVPSAPSVPSLPTHPPQVELEFVAVADGDLSARLRDVNGVEAEVRREGGEEGLACMHSLQAQLRIRGVPVRQPPSSPHHHRTHHAADRH